MFKRIIPALVMIFAISSFGYAQDIKTEKDSLSYSIGMSIGANLKQNNELDVNLDKLIEGLKAQYAGTQTALTEEDMNQILQSFAQVQQKKAQEAQAAAGEEAKAKGQQFLQENRKKEGVKVTQSGLQYKVLKEGTGASPKATDKVKVHYTGKLIDGTVFDSSVERGEPAEFPVNRVIPGWTEALQMMKEGGKWMLYIPSDLAYGPNGAGGSIGPNETLIFEVELIEVMDDEG
ncbi:MAG: FKBP-type peptidyl-prolyl cis-trans isomerase [Candidatus Kapaibacterium sp.]